MPGWNESTWFAMFVGVALKGSAVLGLAWLTAALLRRRSAAARHQVWTAAMAGLLLLPILSIVLPAFPVPGPAAHEPSVNVLFRTTAAKARTPRRLRGTRSVRPRPRQSIPRRGVRIGGSG